MINQFSAHVTLFFFSLGQDMEGRARPCDGWCLMPTARGYAVRQRECEFNCRLVRCDNFAYCGNAQPQFLASIHNHLCINCDLQFQTSLHFRFINECALCHAAPVWIGVDLPQCEHQVCLSCFRDMYRPNCQSALDSGDEIHSEQEDADNEVQAALDHDLNDSPPCPVCHVAFLPAYMWRRIQADIREGERRFVQP